MRLLSLTRAFARRLVAARAAVAGERRRISRPARVDRRCAAGGFSHHHGRIGDALAESPMFSMDVTPRICHYSGRLLRDAVPRFRGDCSGDIRQIFVIQVSHCLWDASLHQPAPSQDGADSAAAPRFRMTDHILQGHALFSVTEQPECTICYVALSLAPIRQDAASYQIELSVPP